MNFLKCVLAAVVIPFSLLSCSSGSSGIGGAAGIKHGPMLTLAEPTSMTVVWTTGSLQRGSVHFGTTPSAELSAEDSVPVLMHQVRLPGLTANTRYYYRVVNGTESTGTASFWSAPDRETPFVFAVYGDTRTNHDDHIAVLRQMAPYEPRFVLNTGDLVAKNLKENWDAFFTDLCVSTRVGSSAPYYASPGNHESGAMYYDDMVLPSNNPEQTEQYYSFRYGSVYVLMLNSEVPFEPASPQYRWMLSELQSPAAREAAFRIAVWHRPPYSTSNHGSDMKLRSVLCPPIEAGKVDLVFNGHDHCYERTKPINGTTYIVAGGGGAPLYDFKADSSWVAYKEKATHCCILSVHGDTLDMTMVRGKDGSVGDSLRVVRRGDTVRQ